MSRLVQSMNILECCMQKQDLIDIANTVIPFGKYKGRVLIDLPEEYLLWFARLGGGR